MGEVSYFLEVRQENMPVDLPPTYSRRSAATVRTHRYRQVACSSSMSALKELWRDAGFGPSRIVSNRPGSRTLWLRQEVEGAATPTPEADDEPSE